MRQARIRRIKKLCKQLLPSKDEGPVDPLRKAAYFIGKSQNKPVDISQLLKENSGDPVTKVRPSMLSPSSCSFLFLPARAQQNFLANLRRHLLPRIQQKLLSEARADPANLEWAIPTLEKLVNSVGSDSDTEAQADRVLIPTNRLYQHEILHVNYTTYDMRREQDILNPNTTRRDFMCLREDPETSEGSSHGHRYVYGRILGIYHVNVVYLGEGSLDRRERRFDLLLVRWFTEIRSEQNTWEAYELDRLRFQPFDSPGAIDFLDPAALLRAAHIVPRFSSKRVAGVDFEPISKLAKDGDDWNEYYVNR